MYDHLIGDVIKDTKKKDPEWWPKMEEKIQKQAAHEYRSAAILEKLLDESKFWDLHPKLPNAERPLKKERDLDFIKNLITFSKDYEEEKKKKDDFVEVFN